MQRASDLVGVSVLDLECGKIVGKVVDLIFSLQSGALEGVFVKLPFRRQGLGFVQLSSIKSIGDTALTILSSDCIQKGVKRPEGVLKKTLINKNGDFLGHITDVIIEEKERMIVGLETSKSVWEDLKSGRSLFALSPETVFDDVVLVPENCHRVSPEKLLEHAKRLAPFALLAKTKAVSFLNRRE